MDKKELKQETIREKAEARFDEAFERPAEKREVSPDEKIVADQLRKEIELMETDETLKKEAETKAQKIEFLGQKEKIKHLLQIAREKGVVFAIQVAKRTNDPYLLDILHDILAKEGFYKDLTK